METTLDLVHQNNHMNSFIKKDVKYPELVKGVNLKEWELEVKSAFAKMHSPLMNRFSEAKTMLQRKLKATEDRKEFLQEHGKKIYGSSKPMYLNNSDTAYDIYVISAVYNQEIKNREVDIKSLTLPKKELTNKDSYAVKMIERLDEIVRKSDSKGLKDITKRLKTEKEQQENLLKYEKMLYNKHITLHFLNDGTKAEYKMEDYKKHNDKLLPAPGREKIELFLQQAINKQVSKKRMNEFMFYLEENKMSKTEYKTHFDGRSTTI